MGLQVQHRSFQRIFRIASFLNHFSSIVYISFEEFSSYKTSLEWGGPLNDLEQENPLITARRIDPRGWGLCLCLVAQLCLTFCNPIDCSLPGSSVHGDSPGENTEVG